MAITVTGTIRDAATLGMCWNKLLSIVDEATATLLRTAFSRIVTEAWDFSCALFNTQGDLIAQGRHGLPSFLGCMALAVRDFLAAYPPDSLEPGDSLITTDPWIGASQINDVFFVTPITVGVRLDRITHPALGLFGGRPGAAAFVAVNGEPVHAKKTVRLLPGDVFSVRSSGGAGYGDPRERDPEALQRDVRDGYVSPGAARAEYELTREETPHPPSRS
jgi:N-methylhydantoinase B/oxoprolinase/acetone carboxylase alpha subunit